MKIKYYFFINYQYFYQIYGLLFSVKYLIIKRNINSYNLDRVWIWIYAKHIQKNELSFYNKSRRAILMIRYNSMSQNTGKNRVEFRCRPVRSTSCTNKIDVKQHQPSKPRQKNKVVLHVGKKLVLDGQRKKNYNLQMPMNLDITSIASNDSKTNRTQSDNDNECQFESKATMKKKLSIKTSQQHQIKKMLIQLSGNQNEMMAMLKSIMKKSCNSEHQSCRRITQLSIRNLSQSQYKEKLKISRVMNQVIDNNLSNEGATMTKSFKLQRRLSEKTELFGNILPQYLAHMLVDVMGDRLNSNIFYDSQMDLRELISRRLQSYHLNYSYFLETLLRCNSLQITRQKFEQILSNNPFLLNYSQIQLINKTLFIKQQEEYSVNQLAQKMRYFVEDKPLLQKNLVKMRILQFKSIFVSKKRQLMQSFKRVVGDCQLISLKNLQKILFDLRFEDMEIQILIAKLCIVSTNVNQLHYMKLFETDWLESL